NTWPGTGNVTVACHRWSCSSKSSACAAIERFTLGCAARNALPRLSAEDACDRADDAARVWRARLSCSCARENHADFFECVSSAGECVSYRWPLKSGYITGEFASVNLRISRIATTRTLWNNETPHERSRHRACHF